MACLEAEGCKAYRDEEPAHRRADREQRAARYEKAVRRHAAGIEQAECEQGDDAAAEIYIGVVAGNEVSAA